MRKKIYILPLIIAVLIGLVSCVPTGTQEVPTTASSVETGHETLAPTEGELSKDTPSEKSSGTTEETLEYTVEKLDLPLTKGYVKTLFGYYTFVYDPDSQNAVNRGGEISRVGRADSLRFLKEEDTVLPCSLPAGTETPEVSYILTGEDAAAIMGDEAYSGRFTASYRNERKELCLYIVEEEAPASIKCTYGSTKKPTTWYHFVVGDTEGLILEVTDSNPDDPIRFAKTLVFDDGVVNYQLSSGVYSIEELIRICADMGKASRRVEKADDATDVGETFKPLSVRYSTDYTDTVMKYRISYERAALRTVGYYAVYEQNSITEVSSPMYPQADGFEGETEPNGDVVYRSEKGEFRYTISAACLRYDFKYTGGVSFYTFEIGNQEGLAYLIRQDDRQQAGLFFSNDEIDFELVSSSLSLNELFALALSVGEGKAPEKSGEFTSGAGNVTRAGFSADATMSVGACGDDLCVAVSFRQTDKTRNKFLICALGVDDDNVDFDMLESFSWQERNDLIYRITLPKDSFDGGRSFYWNCDVNDMPILAVSFTLSYTDEIAEIVFQTA